MDDKRDPSRSWEANAAAWTAAVRNGAIASRRLGTDAAIVGAILAHRPRRVLDVGCGEGWLARELASHGVEVVGIDASVLLVASARELGGGTFHVCAYADLATSTELRGGRYHVVVCNFALLGDDVVSTLRALLPYVDDGGALIVQTVHPWTARDGSYANGWRMETFSAFGDAFPEPMPWYFRTLESWVADVTSSGYIVTALREPLNRQTGEPLSLLIVASRPVRSVYDSS